LARALRPRSSSQALEHRSGAGGGGRGKDEKYSAATSEEEEGGGSAREVEDSLVFYIYVYSIIITIYFINFQAVLLRSKVYREHTTLS
jgi:hypothetical protein